MHPIQNPNLLESITRKPSLKGIRNLFGTKSLFSRLYSSFTCVSMHTYASKGHIFSRYLQEIFFFQIDPIKDSGFFISSSYHCLRQHNHPEESKLNVWILYQEVSTLRHAKWWQFLLCYVMRLKYYFTTTKKLMDKSKAGKKWIGQQFRFVK